MLSSRLLTIVSFLLIITTAPLIHAADFQKGVAAAKRGDFATALTEWKPLAEQGDADAQYNLGRMYDNGYGTPQDYKAALKWYTAAAEQGVAQAQYLLGLMYNTGQGVQQDDIQAYMWWNLAATNRNNSAARNRDIIAKKMTASQIQEAQKLAREWVSAH